MVEQKEVYGAEVGNWRQMAKRCGEGVRELEAYGEKEGGGMDLVNMSYETIFVLWWNLPFFVSKEIFSLGSVILKVLSIIVI